MANIIWKQILILCQVLALSACSIALVPTSIPMPVITPTVIAKLANPASTYCVEQGNKLEIRTAADGSQTGICILPDKSECEEWVYFRGECNPVPTTVGSTDAATPGTTITSNPPLAILPQIVSNPSAVLVNTSDARGITAYDPSGLALGEWQTASMTGDVIAAGSVNGSVSSTTLVFWDAGQREQGLYTSLAGNISHLLDISRPAIYTGMVGIPASPLVAYSTMRSGEQSGSIHSEVFLGDFHSLVSAEPALVVDNSEFKYITPVAIRAENQQPVGIWFTFHMYGIGGSPGLGSNNHGLYYFEISTGITHEYLSQDKNFTNLSANQAYAAWVPRMELAEMQLTELASGRTLSFPMRPDSEKSAGRGTPSPSGSSIAWLEGINFDQGNIPAINVRVAAQDGSIIGEFPHSSFAKASGFGMDSNINLLGWLNDDTLLVGVSQIGKGGPSAIVSIDTKNETLSLFANGKFAGFAYR